MSERVIALRRSALLLAVLLVLALAFASRADAYVYWASDSVAADQGQLSTTTIGHANLDGTGVNQNFTINATFASGVAVNALATPSPPSGSPTPPPCSGKAATIVGTEGNDAIGGTAGKDVIVGLDGNDKLSGLAGNDLLCGGAGTDTLKAGKGNDKLYGQKGNDTLKGGPGKDKLNGGAGKDKQVQ